MYLENLLADLPWIVQALARLIAAAVLGGIIGFERERRGRSAGFRTQMLVSVGACLAMLVALLFVRNYAVADARTILRLDPIRIAYGVMGGIGFLGAGAIITRGAGIHGLTTAASLWCTAAVGLTVGQGAFEIAAIAVVLILIILWLLKRIDQIIPSPWHKRLRVEGRFAVDKDLFKAVRQLLVSRDVRISRVNVSRDMEKATQTIILRISARIPDPVSIVNLVAEMPGVLRVHLK